MTASDVVSIIGALGIGSFIGQYLIGSHQRREVRSHVLAALERAEAARWASEEPKSPGFNEAMRELETASLIARIPRTVVAHYKVVATAAAWLSFDEFDRNPDREFAGGINSEFADGVRAAAGEMSRLAWTPWLGRLGLTRRLTHHMKKVEAIDEDGVASVLKRARVYVV